VIDGRRIRALWHRERAALFGTPLAWTVAAIFALAAGVVELLVGLRAGVPASIAPAGGAAAWCMLFLAPALAVRSATEDRRTGFAEVLAAGPASSEEIALSRFLGAMAAIALAVTAALIPSALAVGHFARLDWGELATITAGLMAVGAALAATGLLVGTLSRSAPVAAFVSSVVWLALVVCGQVLPPIVGPDYAEAAFALDPMRRISRALAGVLDTGDLIAFAGVSMGLLIATAVVLHAQRTGAAAAHGGRLRTALGLLASLVAAVALADLAADVRVGPSIALARGPSAPLANDTVAALREASDTIVTLIRPASNQLPAADDLLLRVEEAGLLVQRFDPDDIDDPAYAQWLETLSTREQAAGESYDQAIDRGLDACASLAASADEVAPELDAVPGDAGARARALAAAWREFAAQWGELRRAIAAMRVTTPAQPFGDRMAAAALLRDALAAWSQRTAESAIALNQAGGVRSSAAGRVAEAQSRILGAASAQLRSLPALRHAMLTRAMADGSALVIERGESLLARPGWMVAGGGLDARARAESVLLDALRLPPDAPVPIVIIMHAEPRSMLRATASGADASAMRDALAAAGFEVLEWSVPNGDEPRFPTSRPHAWWIVPPIIREGVEPSKAERALVAAVGRLIDRGEPVVLSVSPSLLAVAGQRDPWADLASRLGVEARTDRMWLEAIPVDEGRVEFRSDLFVQVATLAHAVGPAVDGLPIHFPSASPLRARLEAVGAVAIIAMPTDEATSLSRDWRGARHRRGRDDERPSPEDACVMAVEPAAGSRALVIGSPDWMLSAVARRTVASDAGRAMLASPGNLALAVAGSVWVSGSTPVGMGSAADAERAARVPVLSRGQHAGAMVGLTVLAPALLWCSGWWIDRRRRHA